MNEKTCIPFSVDGNARLLCPVCGSNLVHPIALECRSPGQATGHVIISKKGISIDTETLPIGRGVFIWLKFRCENGDFFEYNFHFHKGNTFVNSDSPPDEHEVESEAENIWRD